MRAMLLLVLTVLLAATPGAQTPAPPYKNASLPIDQRVKDLLGRMTLEEKFWQVFMIPGSLDDPAHDYSTGVFGLQISTGEVKGRAAGRAHAERINTIQRYFVEQTRLGIPIIPFEEALHGLAREGATMFPQAIGMAATWDVSLMRRVSEAAARETGSRGIRMVLSPVINIADDVRWGRVEETYGEDPYLSAEMGRAFIETFERAGIITTPKHFIANVGEGGRDSYPIDLSERILTERYLPPFEVAVKEAKARSVMTAYNSVDGSPATQNARLMNGILKGEWGFRGFIISDASATGGATVLHMTEPNTPAATKHAFESGLDVVFQSQYGQQRPYLEAFQKGMIAESVIDAAVTRVLRAKFEIGLFEKPYVDVDAAATANGADAHRALAREAARASLVLLRNERQTLPFGAAVRSIAVIGTDATEARLGGYSGPGIAPVSILDGIRQRAGADVSVRHAEGPGRLIRELVVVPAEHFAVTRDGKTQRGLWGEYWDNNSFTGAPRLTRLDPRVDFRWTLSSPGRGIPFDWYSARWNSTLTIPQNGVRRIAVEANDGYRLYLDDKLIIDNWRKQSYGTQVAEVALTAGSSHALRLEYFESTGIARVKLLWDAGADASSTARIDEAVALARTSDAAIVVVGLEEGEFRDRAFLKLPGRQEALIQAVAATGRPTTVLIIGGSAVTMGEWLEKVGAVAQAWYPGEMGGPAVADVLFGDYNPAGRLPITFPVFEGQLPLSYNHKPTGRGDDYLDLTGMPLFPFGFGLSYTTFEYSNLVIAPAEMAANGTATVRCTVRNSGAAAGDEVVQLYIRDVLGSVARPVMELKGFERIHLRSGESRDVTFTLGPQHLRMLDVNRRWIVEPGVFRVMVGASSKDIRLRGQLVVTSPGTARPPAGR
jgi:beta-glucosidase